MLKSLKAWFNIPFTHKRYLSINGTGVKQFAEDAIGMCYADGSIKIVKDARGKEIVSNQQLYVDGTSSIKELDNIIFEGRESEVKAIGYFYRNGVVDLKVVYL